MKCCYKNVVKLIVSIVLLQYFSFQFLNISILRLICYKSSIYEMTHCGHLKNGTDDQKINITTRI